MSSNAGKLVCVTGANGYLASWLIKFLLLRGYTIKGTFHDPNNPTKLDNLLRLDGAKERLKLIKADLLEEGSFDPAIWGCEGVFHTASPVALIVNDPQTELIDPAVKGTLNILKSCAKSPSVKRVVLTSSMATVYYTGKPRTPEVIVDETWFSDPHICMETEQWHVLSKILVEHAAWKYAKENSIDLVTINPSFVVGPLLQPWQPLQPLPNESSSLITKLINGALRFPNHRFGCTDVKDVANAHIQAFEISSASGRYCMVETVVHFSDILKILHELCPTLQIPEKCVEDRPLMSKFQVSKEKAKTLGIEFTPLEASLKEMVKSLEKKNLPDLNQICPTWE